MLLIWLKGVEKRNALMVEYSFSVGKAKSKYIPIFASYLGKQEKYKRRIKIQRFGLHSLNNLSSDYELQLA
jgi:hypothetical protein